MLLVALFQSLFSVIVKLLSVNATLGLEVLAYYIIPLLFFIPGLLRSDMVLLKTNRLGFFFLRGLFAASSVFCFFYAARNVHLGVAAVLFNTTPVFVPLLASVFLKEHTSKQVYIGIIISLIGVIVVIHPSFNGLFTFASFVGLASGILMAMAQVMLRYLVNKKVAANQIVFSLYLMSAIAAILILVVESLFVKQNWINLSLHTGYLYIIGLLFLLGISSLIAQRLLTWAFHFMPAGKLVPLLYVSVPVSSLIGWWGWQQYLDIYFYFGAILVLIGVLFIAFENR